MTGACRPGLQGACGRLAGCLLARPRRQRPVVAASNDCGGRSRRRVYADTHRPRAPAEHRDNGRGKLLRTAPAAMRLERASRCAAHRCGRHHMKARTRHRVPRGAPGPAAVDGAQPQARRASTAGHGRRRCGRCRRRAPAKKPLHGHRAAAGQGEQQVGIAGTEHADVARRDAAGEQQLVDVGAGRAVDDHVDAVAGQIDVAVAPRAADRMSSPPPP